MNKLFNIEEVHKTPQITSKILTQLASYKYISSKIALTTHQLRVQIMKGDSGFEDFEV